MENPVKFAMDEHVANAVVAALRRRGVDVLSTVEADLSGATDEEQLRKATEEGRVLFSQDDDLLRLHSAGMKHAGIAYAVQGVPLKRIIRGLVLIHQVLDAKDMEGRVEFL